jgi:hypothetical protein
MSAIKYNGWIHAILKLSWHAVCNEKILMYTNSNPPSPKINNKITSKNLAAITAHLAFHLPTNKYTSINPTI